jgi:hypothetical protein
MVLLVFYLRWVRFVVNVFYGRPAYNKLAPHQKHSGQPHKEPKINQQTKTP